MTRTLLRALAALVLLAVTGLIGWRVLAPAEVPASATTPYPPAPTHAPGVTGRTNVAPLIVAGRVRVFAAKHQVRADDAPVDAAALHTARWSFRRWPEQLSAVVAGGTTVVTRWSDGALVALDARTGEVGWRAAGPDSPGYAGHRTGAAAVWDPPGLRVAAGTVVVTAGEELAGYDLSTGTARWRTTVPPGCAEGFVTSGGSYACPAGSGYDVATGAAVSGWPAGPYTAVGCGSSGCAALQDGAGRGWLVSSAVPERAPALDAPDATVAAGVIVVPGAGAVRAVSADGAPLWSWAGTARVLGGSGTSVLLLTGDNTLVGVDARSGTQVYRFPLAFGTESTKWKPGRFRVAGGYLAVERLNVDAPADPESPIYYLTLDTVLMAAVG